MTSLDYPWMIERVNRCYEQIWQVSEQILAINGSVILDLGFTTKSQRDIFSNRAKEININPEIHYLDAPKNIRKKRVDKRNIEKDPSVMPSIAISKATQPQRDPNKPKFVRINPAV